MLTTEYTGYMMPSSNRGRAAAVLDVRKFVAEQFHDAERLISTVRAYGLEAPNKQSVYKWLQRGTIPSEWLPILLVVLELDRGSPPRLAQYLRGRGGN